MLGTWGLWKQTFACSSASRLSSLFLRGCLCSGNLSYSSASSAGCTFDSASAPATGATTGGSGCSPGRTTDRSSLHFCSSGNLSEPAAAAASGGVEEPLHRVAGRSGLLGNLLHRRRESSDCSTVACSWLVVAAGTKQGLLGSLVGCRTGLVCYLSNSNSAAYFKIDYAG